MLSHVYKHLLKFFFFRFFAYSFGKAAFNLFVVICINGGSGHLRTKHQAGRQEGNFDSIWLEMPKLENIFKFDQNRPPKGVSGLFYLGTKYASGLSYLTCGMVQ